MIIKKVSSANWLFYFFGTNVSVVVLFWLAIWFNFDRLPAPQLSNNYSLNEKLRWARSRLHQGHCGTLILGSSLALNSIDYRELVKGGYDDVLNLGAWNLRMPDQLHLLETVFEFCSPNTVIVPLNHDDFKSENDSREIDFDKIRDYWRDASGTRDFWLYARAFDPIDLWTNYLTSEHDKPLGRTVYTSLEFDPSGAVLFDCSGFQVNPRRWDGYLYDLVDIKAQPLRTLAAIAELAQRRGIKLIVAETPMRRAALEALDKTVMSNLRRDIDAAVTRRGGYFLAAPTDYDDDLFSDYAHLNACGARKWTESLVSSVNSNARD